VVGACGAARGNGPLRQYQSEDGARHPRAEFFVADSLLFAESLFAAGDSDDLFEQASAGGFDGFSVNNGAGVDVHIVAHAIEQLGVGGDFDCGCGFAAEAAAASGGEHDDLAAACHKSGDGDRVVSRGVHEGEAAGGDGFRELVDVAERSCTAFRYGSE